MGIGGFAAPDPSCWVDTAPHNATIVDGVEPFEEADAYAVRVGARYCLLPSDAWEDHPDKDFLRRDQLRPNEWSVRDFVEESRHFARLKAPLARDDAYSELTACLYRRRDSPAARELCEALAREQFNLEATIVPALEKRARKVGTDAHIASAWNLIKLLDARGAYDEAVTVCERALALGRDAEEFTKRLATIRRKLEREEKRKDAIRRRKAGD